MLDKVLLFPYWLALKIRDSRYRSGRKESVSAGVPTICVGNITAGGTGKTPHTEMILRTLLASGKWAPADLAVLSRGYRRKSKGFRYVEADGSAAFYGDEPLQMKRKFPEVTVAVDKDRVGGCRQLCHPEEGAPAARLVVLDDAFQYRRLKASLNIVLVDYNRPVFKDMLLPLGRLRDLPERITDADVVIVTKCPYELEDEERAAFTAALGTRPEQTVLFSRIRYCGFEPVFSCSDTRYVYSKELILFSGIARNTPLLDYLSDTYKVVDTFDFPDHHKFSKSDFRALGRAVKKHPFAMLATTEKDKQRVLDSGDVQHTLMERMFHIPIEAEFLSEAEKEQFEAVLARLS